MILTKQEILRANADSPWIMTQLLQTRLVREPNRAGLIPSRAPDFDSALPVMGAETSGLIPTREEDEISEPDLELGPRQTFTDGLVLYGLIPERVSQIGFDLTVSDEIYLSHRLRNIKDARHLRQLARQPQSDFRKISPQGGTILLEADEAGRNFYYIVSQEHVLLPQNLEMLLDARSTTGRLGCMCIPRGNHYDASAPKPIVMAAQPSVVHLELVPGKSSISQAVIRYKDSPFLTPEQVRADSANIKLIDRTTGQTFNGSTRFTHHGAALTFSTKRVYVAKPLAKMPSPIAMDAIKEYPWRDFFEFREGRSEIDLDAGRFYLLGTQEAIIRGNVCGILGKATPPVGIGVVISYADFFQPGYSGPITLEYRSAYDHTIVHGDEAGYVLFDKMESQLVKPYSGSYQDQNAPMLPKMFKTD